MDFRVGGDDRPIELLDRPGPQQVRHDPDQRSQIEHFATDVTSIIERVRPVDDIIRGAAAVDFEVAALRARLQESRFQNMLQFVAWVSATARFWAEWRDEAARHRLEPDQPRDTPTAEGRSGLDHRGVRGMAGRDPDPDPPALILLTAPR
jgi:hypothetical protein